LRWRNIKEVTFEKTTTTDSLSSAANSKILRDLIAFKSFLDFKWTGKIDKSHEMNLLAYATEKMLEIKALFQWVLRQKNGVLSFNINGCQPVYVE